MFGKAKKRILSEEEAGSGEVVQATRQLRLAPDRTDSCHPVSGIRLDLHTALQPDLLPSKSHTELFTQIRSSRVDRYQVGRQRSASTIGLMLDSPRLEILD